MYLIPRSRHYNMVLLARSKRKSKDVLNLVEVFISLDSSLRSCLNGPYERFYESFTEAFRYIEEHGLKPVGQHLFLRCQRLQGHDASGHDGGTDG